MLRSMLVLAALLAAPPPSPPAYEPQPPEDTIDFLGRRSECLALRQMFDGEAPSRSPFREAEWRRLRCDAVGGEEADLRRRHRGDQAYIAALDRHPERFELGAIIATAFNGGVAMLQRMELSGTGTRGTSFRVTFDKTASDGRATAVQAFLNGRPAGRAMLDNRRFDYIDLESVTVSLGRAGPPLYVEFRYGHPRPYCFENDDARPLVKLIFSEDGRIEATEMPFVNCGAQGVAIPPAQLGLGE